MSNRMDNEKKFQILSLSGGGFRGLYTAKVLEIMENYAGKPIGQAFDLISGTSVGGILALAVAFEVPMSKVVELFEKRGNEIFSRKPRRVPFISDLLSAPYDPTPLKNLLDEIFGDNKIGDLKHRVLIPSINYTTGKIKVFKTSHHETLFTDIKHKITDIALATSAAPTYFPRHIIGQHDYIDGGLFANSPSLIGLHEAEYLFDLYPKDINLISIGTMSSFNSGDVKHTSGGYKDWGNGSFTKAAPNIIDIVLSSQQQLMNTMVAHRFKKYPDQLHYIDTIPTLKGSEYIGLDVVSNEAIKVLIANAEQKAQEAIGNPLINKIIKNQATQPNWHHTL